MDDYYSIPVNSDLKSGLALMASDMDIFQSPAFCEGMFTKKGTLQYIILITDSRT